MNRKEGEPIKQKSIILSIKLDAESIEQAIKLLKLLLTRVDKNKN